MHRVGMKTPKGGFFGRAGMKTSVLSPLVITLGLILWSSGPASTQPLAIVHGTVKSA